MLNISNADGISFYVKRDDTLEFKILKNKTLNADMGGLSEKDISIPPLKLFDESGSPNMKAISTKTERPFNIKYIKVQTYS